MLFLGFKNQAKRKLSAMSELTIVSITASYGKTSIKNFLNQIIKEHFKTYATPRSVNTIAGILKDINVDLPANTKVYITEAGARERGDIYKIATLLNPQYIVVGKIGAQHMEYFKTIENIILTKLELLATKRLKKGFIYHTIEIKDDERLEKFGKSDREYEQERAKEGKEPAIAFDIRNINATLEGLHFELKVDGTFYPFEAPNLLGAFNAQNIAGAILVARELGLKIEELQERVKLLKPIGHRLQKIEANGKTIIDDSFNGNVDGMMEGFRLASTYQGRKVLVTPGLVESTDEDNTKVAIKADKIFDVVMITGSLNSELFDKNIHNAKKILLKDKAKMQEMLEANTQVGDLILFANDAPNFI
jgi:UDP-N-acetylmuramoyl-tripeptide--D-alanyl-D-alanine ligase